MAERVVSEEDKALAADYRKRIDAALVRPQIKAAFEQFEKNRKLLRGGEKPDGTKKLRTNLYFANIASTRPQIYAKDPEFSVRPTKAVSEEQFKVIEKFCETSETLLTALVIKRAKLKKRAKRLLTATMATSVGWWKAGWQEDKKTDPLYDNQIKDLQDNLNQLETEKQQLKDPEAGTDIDLKMAKVRESIAGLEAKKAEVPVAHGFLLDFVMSEDILILDDSVRELGDYERSEAIAHRVWMTRQAYREKFGYDCAKGNSYTEISGQQQQTNPNAGLLCVWEIWDQSRNRILTVCNGEEGFCCAPITPDWTGERWYPFFGLMFNEIDGAFYPLSDIELIEPLVTEYNDSRNDLVKDRKDARPFTVVRKGGSLTPKDVENIRNRDGNNVIVVEGVGGQPIANDLQGVNLGQIDPAVYDTAPARQDIEQLVGGGDAARGSVLEAKTATEAEILSQGLRGRSAERQDTMEDLLSDVGAYALQMMLRKMKLPEVQRYAGPEAVWPQLSQQQIFEQVTVEVRGGSTGKPDRLQEQDRWTKLLPVVEKAMGQVAELRMSGNHEQAQAVIELVKETMRRFDERLDLESFLPTPKEGEEQAPADPMQSPQVQQLMQQGQELIAELQAKVQELEQQLADKQGEQLAKVEQARIDADKAVRVAEVTAPIEANAKVEAARVTAEAQAAAKAQIDRENAAREAERQERERVEKEAKAAEESQVEQLAAQFDQNLAAIGQDVDKLKGIVVQMAEQANAPKPRMRVVTTRNPDKSIVSRLEPDEETR